jgi:hypothetical protein
MPFAEDSVVITSAGWYVDRDVASPNPGDLMTQKLTLGQLAVKVAKESVDVDG